MGTRITQQHPRELEAIATHFMEAVWPMVVGYAETKTSSSTWISLLSHLLLIDRELWK